MHNEFICKELVEQFGQRQASHHYPCPRCGEDAMSESLWRNALSRNGNVCICNQCGSAEALEAFMGDPLPVSEWAVLQNPSAYAKRT
ncbi:hypothetical protein RFF05_06930 [Bengtsoniella intestinalis]|uniref:hypothetical protein n=1 Tax=Bengtsoniella intestinalis TaxID=3073143 RepID=UPI00391F6F1C